MSANKTIRIKGVSFQLYEKSIRVDGIAGTVFYGRAVSKKDAQVLSGLIEMGKRLRSAEISERFDGLISLMRGS